MKTEEFNQLLEERIRITKTILSKKGDEYATEDRLHNFKVAARINHCTQAQALWGMATKHLVSIIDIIDGREFSDEIIDEKITDMINYLILLEAVLKEGK